MVVITIFFLGVFYRFFQLQIVRGDEYRHEQVVSLQREERIPARRGLILDRYGQVLARNVQTHDLVMRPLRVRHTERLESLLRRLLGLNDEEDAQLRELVAAGVEGRDRFDRVVIRSDLVSEFCPFDSGRLEHLEPKQKTLWCPQCGENYGEIPTNTKRCPRDHRHRLRWNPHHTGAECTRDHSKYVAEPGTACPNDGAVLRERSWALRCPICSRVFNNEVAIVKSHLYELPGIAIETRMRRDYPQGKLTAHLVGYINKVNARDLERHEVNGYQASDRIGRAGAERAFEEELRGKWGVRHYLVDRPQKGGPLHKRSDPEQPDVPVADGQTLRLTIDIELQKLVKKAMEYRRSGAAVVIHVETGEILALYSKPSFDPNLWAGRLPAEEYRATINNPYTPMLNKALTAYAPGSVYKTVSAVGGLHRHEITPAHEEHCHGYYEYHGRRFRCHNRSGHGSLDLVHAMSRSCDIYFYKLGETLGMDALHEYATRYLGFGVPTGIEIGEANGLVPNKEWHRQTDRAWMPGFTLSTAVGQKDVRATPLQVARSYAAMANKGRLPIARLLMQVEDSNGNVLRVTRPKTDVQLPITDEHLGVLQEAFWRAVNDEHGTAFGARMDGLEVSGKTGTAEAAERKAGVSEEIAVWLKDDHAWFAGYAPSRKPEISVAVFLEHGHSGGKEAAPVAMKIFKAYFARRAQLRPPSAEPAPPEGELPNPIRSPAAPAREKEDAEPKVNRTPIDLP